MIYDEDYIEDVHYSETDDGAKQVVAGVEIDHGRWSAFGGDGRLTNDISDIGDATLRSFAGCGYRARFRANPHGGNYGWGPLGRTAEHALTLLLAAEVAALRERIAASESEAA